VHTGGIVNAWRDKSAADIVKVIFAIHVALSSSQCFPYCSTFRVSIGCISAGPLSLLRGSEALMCRGPFPHGAFFRVLVILGHSLRGELQCED
jgi:hypothetical protein